MPIKKSAIPPSLVELNRSVINYKEVEHIPCLFLPNEKEGNKLLIYFHGNAEDIGLSFEHLYMFGESIGMHVLAVEYPGYGLY